MDEASLKRLTIKDLKEECRRLKLTVGGNKAALVTRILECLNKRTPTQVTASQPVVQPVVTSQPVKSVPMAKPISVKTIVPATPIKEIKKPSPTITKPSPTTTKPAKSTIKTTLSKVTPSPHSLSNKDTILKVRKPLLSIIPSKPTISKPSIQTIESTPIIKPLTTTPTRPTIKPIKRPFISPSTKPTKEISKPHELKPITSNKNAIPWCHKTDFIDEIDKFKCTSILIQIFQHFHLPIESPGEICGISRGIIEEYGNVVDNIMTRQYASYMNLQEKEWYSLVPKLLSIQKTKNPDIFIVEFQKDEEKWSCLVLKIGEILTNVITDFTNMTELQRRHYEYWFELSQSDIKLTSLPTSFLDGYTIGYNSHLILDEDTKNDMEWISFTKSEFQLTKQPNHIIQQSNVIDVLSITLTHLNKPIHPLLIYIRSIDGLNGEYYLKGSYIIVGNEEMGMIEPWNMILQTTSTFSNQTKIRK